MSLIFVSDLFYTTTVFVWNELKPFNGLSCIEFYNKNQYLIKLKMYDLFDN